MQDALKRCAGARGLTELYAPVRSDRKHLQPRTPMGAYPGQRLTMAYLERMLMNIATY